VLCYWLHRLSHCVIFWVNTTDAGEYFVIVFSVDKNSAELYMRGDTNRGNSKSRSKERISQNVHTKFR